ncbi:MAG: DM13 domain-containing protein [Cyanobacteria bacterium P01_A01_bin.83]
MQRLSLSLILTCIIGVNAHARVGTSVGNSLSPSKTSARLQLVAKTTPGQFIGVEHPITGKVQIIEENGTKYLVIGQDFQSDRGPDLKVILHKASIVEQSLQEEDYVNLGALKSFSGSQRYLIPAQINLDEYQSVAIWCEKFNATFGYALVK